jgi:hypothetical protein
MSERNQTEAKSFTALGVWAETQQKTPFVASFSVSGTILDLAVGQHKPIPFKSGIYFHSWNRRLAMAGKIDSKVSYFLVGLGLGSLIGILFCAEIR